ncbi:MAG: hypothetical protein FD148_792 [Methylocystaceae bacterium]|nr:MAG: hypothetical protein FD148_792 [Methylocystaceae bacterium]
MIMSLDEAARIGASRGLLGEGEPAYIASWPDEARTAFHEQYAKGRFCRRVAEGRARPLTSDAPAAVYAGMSRAQLVAEYRSRAELQDEFGSADVFVAFVTASLAGRASIHRARVVS